MALPFSFAFGRINSFPTLLPTVSVETSYISVKVYPLFYNKTIVEWSIPAMWGACTFNVYKGDTEAGPWVKVNPTPLSNTNFFADFNVEDFSKFHKSDYIVEVRLPVPDGRYIRSAAVSWDNVRSNIMQIRAAEISRRENILLSRFVGVDSLVFRRKYFGERCPECYNAAIEKVTKDHCKECLGTSFKGGYFVGMPTKISYEVSPNNTQMSYMGKLEVNQNSAWTTAFPSIMTHDIILRIPDFKVFRVEAVNQTEIQTVAVRQTMQLVEKDKSSVEMNLINQAIPHGYLQATTIKDNINTQVGYTL